MGATFVIIVVVLSAVAVVLVIVGVAGEIRVDRRRRAEFDSRVAALGWRRVDRGAVPSWLRSVARRTRLALVDAGGRWYVWQQSSTAFGGRAVNTIAVGVSVAFDSPAAPFEVVRRAGHGAWLSPDVGTGDPVFDRAMILRPTDAIAAATHGPHLREVLGPRLRAALAAGDLPPFRHIDGHVCARWRESPSVASITARVESVQMIATLLRDHA